MEGEREYKDSVFRMLFLEPKNALSLYQALSGDTDATVDDIFIDEKGGTIISKLKHDVAFRVADKYFYLIEHQSTVNPNMPLRMFLDVADILRRYIWSSDEIRRKIYGSRLVEVPSIKLYSFYNGRKHELDKELLLSTAFKSDDSDIEIKVRLNNIKYGVETNEILKKCKPLAEYGFFVREIETNRDKGMILEKAIKNAVELCLEKGILKDFFEKYRGEVALIMNYEYTLEDRLANMKEEGIEEGMAKGMEKGENKLKKLFSLLFRDGRIQDAQDVVTDKEKLNMLYKEYKLA